MKKSSIFYNVFGTILLTTFRKRYILDNMKDDINKNEYMTAQQAAERWGISDRRVRVLCGEGRIKGAVKEGKSYYIPLSAQKPMDGRRKLVEGLRYLKWDSDIIGTIDATNAVTFTEPNYNTVVSLYTRGARAWTPEQFTEFLAERVVSRDRRDIEKILFRCGLSSYDVHRIADYKGHSSQRFVVDCKQ